MQPAQMSAMLRAMVAGVPVIPVLVIADVTAAAPLARALVAGDLPVVEVTLRTPAALDAIRAMARIAGARVGAGTVLTAADVAAAKAAGAAFAVSPGATPALRDACIAADLPLLPGAATASEAMARAEEGFDFLKFFPAEPMGGTATLNALSGPLPRLAFCPTGGITAATMPAYLALPNVPCVGGSWIAPPDLQRAADWDAIAARARACHGERGHG